MESDWVIWEGQAAMVRDQQRLNEMRSEPCTHIEDSIACRRKIRDKGPGAGLLLGVF
jgi:hypothetical protein